VILLLSNRDAVNLAFWPFGLIAAVPLGAVVLVVLLLGLIIGWLTHLPARLGAQRRTRRAERRNAELEARAPVLLPPEQLPPPR
jgi:uncharacterized integral membrane protein